MSSQPPFVRIDRPEQSFVFDLRGDVPVPVWIGPRLRAGEDLAALALSCTRGPHESQPDACPRPSLLPQPGWGEQAPPMIVLTSGGQPHPVRFTLHDVEQGDAEVTFQHADQVTRLSLALHWTFEDGGMVRSKAILQNGSDRSIEIVQLASLVLPLPRRLRRLIYWNGRWAAEMQEQILDIVGQRNLSGQTSNGGRPGFDGAHWFLAEEGASSRAGLAIAAHLSWSGDGFWQIVPDGEGGLLLSMGAALEPGEIELQPGQSFETPPVHWWSGEGGREGARRCFHDHLRGTILPAQVSTPRKVHLNSWEALGFNLDQQSLHQLIDDAAQLGVERFVLDDGWFSGRRNDRTSLGDWIPDPRLFPDGLTPLIDHVQEAGMDFGLWIEPEMVSPESALYRAHPDWCLHLLDRDRPTQRHQLVLDLTRQAVEDHLFGVIDRLLNSNRIAYLKWDHNRPLFPFAGARYRQTVALHRLLDRLTEAHPLVEIESCASGGGRVDLAMLQRCSRIWASDNNDSIERLRINRSWFQFLPPEIVGNHVGPSPNPITGRRLSMDFRAKVAMFGHMGVEADPSRMSGSERRSLSDHIELYKRWRTLIHSGSLSAISCDDPHVIGWLAKAGGQGLALVAQTNFSGDFDAPMVRFPDLKEEIAYRVRLLDPWPQRGAHGLMDPDQWRSGLRLSGRVLADQGLALPLTRPETAWLIHFEETR